MFWFSAVLVTHKNIPKILKGMVREKFRKLKPCHTVVVAISWFL